MPITVEHSADYPNLIVITLPQSITMDDTRRYEADLATLLKGVTEPHDILFDCRALLDPPPDIHKHLGAIANRSPVFTHEQVGRVIVAAYSRLADTTSSIFHAMFPEQAQRLIMVPTWEEALALLGE